MKNKISDSHEAIYKYFVRLANRIGINIITSKYFDIVAATGYTYPIVAKVIPDLIELKCLTLMSSKKGRHSVGTTYLVDRGFKVVRERMPMSKVYKVKKNKKEYIYIGKWTREEIKFIKLSV